MESLDLTESGRRSLGPGTLFSKRRFTDGVQMYTVSTDRKLTSNCELCELGTPLTY